MMRQKRAFLQQHRIFCWSASTSGIQFFGHSGLYLQHWSFGDCGLPKIFGTENVPRLSVKLFIDDYSRQSQPSLNRSPRNLHTSLTWNQSWKPTFENSFLPSLKYMVWEWEKSQIYLKFSRTTVIWKCTTSKWLKLSANEYQMFHLW